MKKIILFVVVISLFVISMTSCRTGYGCRGRESWSGMVKRINRP
jgi:hypothetical protein